MTWDLIPKSITRDGKVIASQSFFNLFYYFYQNRNRTRGEIFYTDRQNIGVIGDWVIQRLMQETSNALNSNQDHELTAIQKYFDRIQELSNFK